MILIRRNLVARPHLTTFAIVIFLLALVQNPVLLMTMHAYDDVVPCALLFFGLARGFRDMAFPSIKENILNTNPACDIFAHTYNVSRALGVRYGEDGSGVVNPNEVYLLFDVTTGASSRLLLELDSEFLKHHDLRTYRRHLPFPSDWTNDQMDNMIRQWHSIKKVWSAMERTEIGSIFSEKTKDRLRAKLYRRIGFFRLDLNYIDTILIVEKDLAVVPKMMYHGAGYNDRMFYGDRNHARVWSERFGSVGRYLQWQHDIPKIIVAKQGLHSENFLRWIVSTQHLLPVTIKPFCFQRVRSHGGTLDGDCDLVGASSDPDK